MSWRKWRSVLFACSIILVILILAAFALAPRLIDSAAIKTRIQTVVAEKTGGRFDFQGLALSYWPRPAIELGQVSLILPGRAEATAVALHLSPKIFPLLGGALHLQRLELDDPQLTLHVPDKKTKNTPVTPDTYAELQKTLTAAIEPFAQIIAGPELSIENARISINEGKKNLLEIAGLDLQGSISPSGPQAGQASLQLEFAALNMLRNGRHVKVQNLTLLCNGVMAAERLKIKLEQLSLAKPHLALSGDLVLAPRSPEITLELSATDIDVDATRKTALTLAGEMPSITAIFDYLGGGQVTQIDFTSHGDTWSEVGDLDNMVITGQLQDGTIAIPEIELDLTEVSGDVTISEAVLRGRGLSARLNKSTAHDGSLQIGLTQAQDLFKLKLTLNAELADTYSILQRVFTDEGFNAELKKIGDLQGTLSGNLTLGDSINDVRTKFEISDLDVAPDDERVPVPIAISRGRILLDGKRLDLSQLSGTMGQSTLDDFSCQITLGKGLFLDIGSGRFDLNLAELYPWLVTLEGIGRQMQSVRQLSGQLRLSDLTFTGAVDKPSGWRFGANGMVKNISAQTSLLTEAIDFAGGTFKVQNKQLSFEELHAASEDTTVVASGVAKGFPDQLDRIEFALEGRLGSHAVTALSEQLTVPERYAFRAPLDLEHARITWQPHSTVSFKGNVTAVHGPKLTADVDYIPGQLQVHQLDIKDQHSDASMVLNRNEVSQSLTFSGTLDNATLQSIFVNPPFTSGRLEGDFSVTIPRTGQAKVATTGQLTGENLPVVLVNGHEVHVEKITLRTDGPVVQVDIPKLTLKNLVWEPVRGTLSFSRDRVESRITAAKLCGIDTRGRLSYSGDAFSIDMNVEGKDLDVATSYNCLTQGRVKASGSLNFFSTIEAHGPMNELVREVRGPLKMTLSDGVIDQSNLAASILKILNVTEIFKGRLPKFSRSGLAYKTMTMQGQFDNGTLLIDKFFMAGEALDLFGNGKIDLEAETVEGQLLAAPLKTADAVVKYIPGVNHLLNGTLVSIPVSITGPLEDPNVAILPAAAVSSSLSHMAERIIKSPVRLLEEVLPGENHKEDKISAP